MQLPRTRRLQGIVSWIASFAILLAALAPTVSQAMVAAGWGGPEWVEVCTSHGVRWVAAGEADKNDGNDGDDSLCVGVCAYCFTHAGSFGLTPTAAPVLADQNEPGEALMLQPPRHVSTTRPWSAQQTRAPPYPA